MWKKLLPVFTLCGAAAIAADYNVLDHGLKADGRSDNTAAMAALLAKTAPGDTIRFPGGIGENPRFPIHGCARRPSAGADTGSYKALRNQWYFLICRNSLHRILPGSGHLLPPAHPD